MRNLRKLKVSYWNQGLLNNNMNKLKKRTILIFSLLLVGCSSIQLVNKNTDGYLVKLNKESSVYIIAPDNGKHNGKTYEGTGRAVAKIIFSEFSKYSKYAETSIFIREFEEGLEKAKKQGFTYVVYPEILDWQYTDGAVWTPSPTQRAELKISIFDVQTGSLLDSVVIKVHGPSPWIWVVDAPTQNFFHKPIEKYISSLFNLLD